MSFNKIKVKNSDGLVRDSRSGAILNTNLDSVRLYKSKKSELNKVNDLTTKINSLESDIKEIKNLLTSLMGERITNVNQHK